MLELRNSCTDLYLFCYFCRYKYHNYISTDQIPGLNIHPARQESLHHVELVVLDGDVQRELAEIVWDVWVGSM